MATPVTSCMTLQPSSAVSVGWSVVRRRLRVMFTKAVRADDYEVEVAILHTGFQAAAFPEFVFRQRIGEGVRHGHNPPCEGRRRDVLGQDVLPRSMRDQVVRRLTPLLVDVTPGDPLNANRAGQREDDDSSQDQPGAAVEREWWIRERDGAYA